MSTEKKVRVFGGIKTTADVHAWPFERKVVAKATKDTVPVSKVEGQATKKAVANMSARDRALSAMLTANLAPEVKAKTKTVQQPKKKTK